MGSTSSFFLQLAHVYFKHYFQTQTLRGRLQQGASTTLVQYAVN